MHFRTFSPMKITFMQKALAFSFEIGYNTINKLVYTNIKNIAS